MQGLGFAVVAVPWRAAQAIRARVRPEPEPEYADSHRITSREHVITEVRVVCDGSCGSPPAGARWWNLPPDLEEAVRHAETPCPEGLV